MSVILHYLLLKSVKGKMATLESMQISSHTVDKVAKAKLTLETYYSNLVTQHAERENRYVCAVLWFIKIDFFLL